MGTFSELVAKVSRLKMKREIYELTKEHVERLRATYDPELVDDVLLDLDELCVGPLVDEINKIEGARISPKTTGKKDGEAQAKKKRKPTGKKASS